MFTINIHAHVEVDDLTALLAALEYVDGAYIDIGVATISQAPIPESYFDEVPVNPLAYEYACEYCDFETDEEWKMNEHIARVHDNASQVVIDEIARINGRANHPTSRIMATAVEVNDVHERIDLLRDRHDELVKRCDDYEARFRGLLADFNGACGQIKDQNVKYGQLATQLVAMSMRINHLEGVAVDQVNESTLNLYEAES